MQFFHRLPKKLILNKYLYYIAFLHIVKILLYNKLNAKVFKKLQKLIHHVFVI